MLKKKRGRPKHTDLIASEEAARVINVAQAVKYRPTAVLKLGFKSHAQAVRYVMKRRRGRVGELVGDAVRELFPAANMVQLAAYLVLEHGFTRYRAARATGVDLTNLKSALSRVEAQRKEREARVQHMNVSVEDVA